MAAPAPPAQSIKQVLGLVGQASLLQAIKSCLSPMRDHAQSIRNDPENPAEFFGPRAWTLYGLKYTHGLGTVKVWMRWAEYRDLPPKNFNVNVYFAMPDGQGRTFLESPEKLDCLTLAGGRTWRDERLGIDIHGHKMDLIIEFVMADPLHPLDPFDPVNKA